MRLLSITMICAILAMPVQAGLLGWLIGGTSGAVDCAPTDRACLWQAAATLILENAKSREHDSNTDPYARQMADLEVLRRNGQEPLRARIKAAREHESFLTNFDTMLADRLPPAPITLAQLAQALETETAPDGRELGDYVLDGFKQALERPNPQEAIDLWRTHNELTWSKTGRAFRIMQLWLAHNDVDALEAYDAENYIHGRHRQEVWGNFSDVAELHCQRGDSDLGNRVLDVVMGQFDDYSFDDPIIGLYSQAELLGAVVYCRGEEAALAHMKSIDANRPEALLFLNEKYPDEAERAFVTGAVHDTVEIRTHREMAYWYFTEAKDKAKSQAIFEAGQATQSVWSFGQTAQGQDALLNDGRELMSFESFESDVDFLFEYHPVPEIALTYFVDSFEPDLESAYGLENDLENYVNQIAAGWPTDIAQTAATTARTYAGDLAVRDPDYLDTPDWVMLRLAGLPQPETCVLPETVLQGVLNRLPDYRWGDDRVEALMLIIRYLDRVAAQSSTDAPCALPDLM